MIDNRFFINVVDKSWGAEGWMENSSDRCYKLLLLVRGSQGSLHYHKVKSESFKVVRGVVGVEIKRQEEDEYRDLILMLGDEVDVPPMCEHRFRSLSEESVILETSTHHDDDDTYRIVLSGFSGDA